MAEKIEKQGKPPVKMVKIRLPLIGKDNPTQFVSVNEETFLIERGKTVEVPEYVAKVIETSEEMKIHAYEHELELQNTKSQNN